MAIYSHSRISTFEQCPLRFKFQYIDKLEPEFKTTIEGHLGSSVHAALEKLYGEKKYSKTMTKKELLEYYDEYWKENWSEETKIVKKDRREEDYYEMGIKFLNDYYDQYAPFNQNVIDTEMKILFDLDERGEYKMVGYIDRLDFVENGVYEIHDYKTSSSIKTQQQIDADRQLALYSIAIKEKFPDAKKVKLIWHFLAFGKEMQTIKEDKDLIALKQEMLEKIKKIEAETEFKPNKGVLCGWCQYRKYCPHFKHLYEKEEKQEERIIETEKEDKLIEEYARLNNEKKALMDRIEELKSKIVNLAKEKEVDILYGVDHKITINSSKTLKIPSKGSDERQQLILKLKQKGIYDNVSDLDKTKLNLLLKENIRLLNEFSNLVSIEESLRVNIGKK